MDEADLDKTQVITTTIHKAIDIAHDNYHQLIQYTRLILHTLPTKEQKKHPQIKKILHQYDTNPQLQKDTQHLTTIKKDPEAHYHYTKNTTNDPNLQYAEDLENYHLKTTNQIIQFYGQILQNLNQEEPLL